jgi:hypothetical protein
MLRSIMMSECCQQMNLLLLLLSCGVMETIFVCWLLSLAANESSSSSNSNHNSNRIAPAKPTPLPPHLLRDQHHHDAVTNSHHNGASGGHVAPLAINQNNDHNHTTENVTVLVPIAPIGTMAWTGGVADHNTDVASTLPIPSQTVHIP